MRSLRVPITVHEDAGIARMQEPVTVGVPLPRSENATNAAALVLRDETGAPVPVQARVLSRWGGPVSDAAAPIRFVLLDFRASVAGNATRTLFLSHAPASRSAPGVALARREGGAIVVDTGVLALSFDRATPGPLRLVAGGVSAETLSVEIEENGPQRACVVVRGELSGGYEEKGGTRPLAWTTRWHLTAGSRLARVQTVIENPDRPHRRPFNDRGDPVGKRLGRLALEMDADGETAAKEAARAAGPLAIVQDASGFEARRGKAVVKKGAAAAGWIAAGDTAIGMRSFAENHPKGLSAGGGRLALELFPKAKDGVFFGGARAKTHDLWVRLPGGGADSTAELAAAAMSPLRATVSPAWLQQTRALGPLSVEDPKRWKEHEQTLDRVVAADLAPRDGTIFDQRRAEKAFGWMDYGDTLRNPAGGRRRFGNGEFDLGWVLLRQYLRERDHDRVWLDESEAALRHLMDVDVLHTDDDAPWANRGVRKHDGGEFAQHSRGPDFSHFWVRGLLAYHLTTGDTRAREVAVGEIGGWIAAREDAKRPGWLVHADELRDVGWALIALSDLHDATGEERWIALAHRVAKTMVVPAVGADGTMRDAELLNRRETFAPWQQAYVADGVGRLCLALREQGKRDPNLEAALQRMLDFLAGPAWIDEPTTLYGETYPRMVAFAIDRQGKRDAGDASMTQALADPLVWGWLLFGEPQYRDIALEANRLTFPSGPKRYYDPSIATPAKNAAVRTYFGEAARWMEQTSPHPRTASVP